jgi:putative acetyltransferase
MNQVTIRRAGPSDAEGLAALMADPAVFPQLMQMPYADAEAWRARLAGAGGASTGLQLVAEAEGAIAGSGALFTMGASPRRRHATTLGISVAGPWQGRGVGRLLMQALCDYADRWLGLRRIELQVYADNARAIALYRRFGFEHEGTHRAYALRDGQLVDSLSMARLVPAPPVTPHGAP